MALKNYTTNVSVAKTVSEIHITLAEHGAKKIMFDYASGGQLNSICFSIITPDGERGIKLLANAQRVQTVLHKQKTNSRNKANIDDSPEQAERVAWRIIKDWLTAQLALLETEMVEMEQVFFPYFVNSSGQTVYEAYAAGRLALPE